MDTAWMMQGQVTAHAIASSDPVGQQFRCDVV
jgi:hypothetical protein